MVNENGIPPLFREDAGQNSSQAGAADAGAVGREGVTARLAAFSAFAPGGSAPALAEHNLGLLLDVGLEITVELGRARMNIRDILNLGQGSIIVLDKLAGEPVNVLVNGVLMAVGEVVVIDEQFGVRITEIIPPARRTGLVG